MIIPVGVTDATDDTEPRAIPGSVVTSCGLPLPEGQEEAGGGEHWLHIYCGCCIIPLPWLCCCVMLLGRSSAVDATGTVSMSTTS